MLDYYKILGISQSATLEEIRTAFRKLSIKFHPDKNSGDPYFTNMFLQIKEAYDVLSDDIKKKRYDFKYNFRNSKNSETDSSTANYFEPVIEYFTCNKADFYNGEEITLKWSCFNADSMEIKPFGKQGIKGEKTYKINNHNQEFYNIELISTNTKIGKSKSQSIILTNKLYNDIFTQKVRQLKIEENEIAKKSKWYNEEWIINLLIFYSFIFVIASIFFVPFAIYGIYKNDYFPKDKKINMYMITTVSPLIFGAILAYYLKG